MELLRIQGFDIPKHMLDNLLLNGLEPVDDGDILMLVALQSALKEYRATHGRDPEGVHLREDPFHTYVHAIPNINVMGRVIPVTHKPIWFKKPRIFPIGERK